MDPRCIYLFGELLAGDTVFYNGGREWGHALSGLVCCSDPVCRRFDCVTMVES